MASHHTRALDLLALLTSLPEVQNNSGGLRLELDALQELVAPSGPNDASGSPITKLQSQTGTPPVVRVAEIQDSDSEANAEADQSTFHPFPRLPAELRLKIWAFSFTARIIELHTRRTHYADYDLHGGGPTRWLSLSRNPAALSVNTEARAAALEHYSVVLPLAAPLGANQTIERPGDLLSSSDRALYMNLEMDTVAVLGDPPFERLMRLLEWFRQRDEALRRKSPRRRRSDGGAQEETRGLRRLALSAAPWMHAAGSGTLRVYARTVFSHLEEFAMFLYAERVPPANWAGGMVMLDECESSDHYRRFLISRGKQFREGDSWVKVGMNPLKVMDIRFEEGW